MGLISLGAINDTAMSFGGIKQSGFGREDSVLGRRVCVNQNGIDWRYLNVGIVASRSARLIPPCGIDLSLFT
jgi:hypothetical protein